MNEFDDAAELTKELAACRAERDALKKELVEIEKGDVLQAELAAVRGDMDIQAAELARTEHQLADCRGDLAARMGGAVPQSEWEKLQAELSQAKAEIQEHINGHIATGQLLAESSRRRDKLEAELKALRDESQQLRAALDAGCIHGVMLRKPCKECAAMADVEDGINVLEPDYRVVLFSPDGVWKTLAALALKPSDATGRGGEPNV